MNDANHAHDLVLLLTAICDASARPAAVTLGHGDAMERAYTAAGDAAAAGIEIVELPIAPPAFAKLRQHVGLDRKAVTVYDLFPVSPRLDARYRGIAAQFLAAEALWALEAQGLLGGVPFSVRLDVPKGWDRDPKKLRDRLIAEHALDLDGAAIQTFKDVKARWDAAG